MRHWASPIRRKVKSYFTDEQIQALGGPSKRMQEIRTTTDGGAFACPASRPPFDAWDIGDVCDLPAGHEGAHVGRESSWTL